MITQEQRIVIERLKEQSKINIQINGWDISIDDRICIHSIALSIQSLFNRKNDERNRKPNQAAAARRRNHH